MTDDTEKVPEGLDVALYGQGRLDGARARDSGVEVPNPCGEGTPQFQSWAAGYAAGKVPDEPEPPVRKAPDARDRKISG